MIKVQPQTLCQYKCPQLPSFKGPEADITRLDQELDTDKLTLSTKSDDEVNQVNPEAEANTAVEKQNEKTPENNATVPADKEKIEPKKAAESMAVIKDKGEKIVKSGVGIMDGIGGFFASFFGI